MLAVGSFERLDGIPNEDDLVVVDVETASAYYYDFDTPENPDQSVVDPPPGNPWRITSNDSTVAGIADGAVAVVTDAIAEASTSTEVFVPNNIGTSITVPNLSLSAIQLAHASGIKRSAASGNSLANGGSLGASEATAYTRFRFDAPTGQETDPFLYSGFIQIAAGGLAVFAGPGEDFASAQVQRAFPNAPTDPISLTNGMRVWLDNTLIAEVFVSGSAFANSVQDIDTGSWTVWGRRRELDGFWTNFNLTDIGSQALLPFNAVITDGDVITYDADPGESPDNLGDNTGIGGIASTGISKILDNDIYIVAESGTLQVANVFGFADPFVNPPPVQPPPMITGFLGDVNRDGDLDLDDVQLAFDANDFVVTVTSDVDNGNYDFTDLSLREALSLAADGDRILIAPWVDNIQVTSELVVDKHVQIVGFGADVTSLDGGDTTRVLRVGPAQASISGLTIKRGYTTGSGGGIYLSKGSLTLDRVEVTDNHADQDGGGIFLFETISFGMKGSTVANNTADGDGGGIHFNYTSQPAVIEMSTISGNQATAGGGVFVSRGISRVNFRNVTVTQNSITGAKLGGGIYNELAGKGTPPATAVELDNTIVVDNTNNKGLQRNLSGDGSPFASGSSYNVIGGPTLGSQTFPTGNGNQMAVTPTAAALGPLANNGGSTRTHALLQGSVALDQGSDVVAGDMDQRGFARPVNIASVPDGGGGTADVGAYEAEANEFNTAMSSSLALSSEFLFDAWGVGARELAGSDTRVNGVLFGEETTTTVHHTATEAVRFDDEILQASNAADLIQIDDARLGGIDSTNRSSVDKDLIAVEVAFGDFDAGL